VSPRLFCSGLKVYRLPPASSVASDASVMKLAIGQLVNGLSCHGSAMVIEDSDLEPKIDAMMREDIITEFYGPSRWKELSKKTSSKILKCGDGSCWKMFNPVASLIT
nr:hypothetical protein [Tanacetum cinerariifolium]